MQQGERVIVKLDPDFNPTGKPMPDTLLEKMKADPDFAKLSEEEQKQVISKVKNMIQDAEDVVKYGTLKEKLMKMSIVCNWRSNKKGVPFIALADEIEYTSDSGLLKDCIFKEGCEVNAGGTVLRLVAVDAECQSYLDNNGSWTYPDITNITSPISGKVFSLRKIKVVSQEAAWNEDLFIVSSIPNDTRQEAIKWYKETTGKNPKYKTKYDIELEAVEQEKNVGTFLSKWDL